MNLSDCQTALFVKDIEVSKDFYVNTLGLSIDLDFGKNVIFKSGFAIWEIREDHIIPQQIGYCNLVNRQSIRFELYFETDAIDEIFAALKAKGVNFLNEIHEEIWGQHTIRFFDPDNHLIEVGEAMSVFIGRFHKMGLTPVQISQKTFVPLETVVKFISSM